MQTSRIRWGGAAGLAVLVLAGCAAAPAPSPPPAAAGPREVRLLCHDDARVALFSKLGIPEGERPEGIALADDAVWVLFAPARLLRLTVEGSSVRAETRLGEVGETWSAMDVDPLDGGVWLASPSRLGFRKVAKNWRFETVDLQRVEGDGGFDSLRLGSDAIYAMPTTADHRVWRIDRSGKVLGTAFPAPAPPAVEGSVPVLPSGSGGLQLERDRNGAILVWDIGEHRVHRSDGQGGWVEEDAGRFVQVGSSVARGVDIGGRDEHWYVSGFASLFFWKGGRPVFLGPPSVMERGGELGAVLLLPDGRELFDRCGGALLKEVATDASRYAVLTNQGVIFGDLASAPDLPE